MQVAGLNVMINEIIPMLLIRSKGKVRPRTEHKGPEEE
jgi:hypothetical protein